MAFQHGKAVFVLLNSNNITGYLNKIETPQTADTVETTCFRSDDKTFIPGQKDATMSAEGFYDGDVQAVDEILSNILLGANNGNNMLWFPQGNVLGTYGYGVNMVQTAYNTIGTKDDAVKISMAGHSSVGRERVKIIHALTAEAVTGTGVAQNLLSSGANGGSVYICATSVTGTLAVTVEDSTDGLANWATIATFTNLSAAGHERLVIPGAIKQYVRVSHTITTGPSTFLVAICKK